LFWVPLSPVGIDTLGQLRAVRSWLADPSAWRLVLNSWLRGAGARPVQTAALFIIALALFALRRRLLLPRNPLPAAAPGGAHLVRHPLAALVLTALIALPLPLTIWALGLPLHVTREPSPLVLSLGGVLPLTGITLLVALGLAGLFDEHGV